MESLQHLLILNSLVEETLCLARLGVKWVRFSPIQFMMDVSLHENRYVVHILDTPRVTKSHPHSWNVVQLVERLTVNQVVAGSSPAISVKSVIHSMSCLWMKTRCTRSTDFNALSPSGKAQDFDSCMHWFESSKGSLELYSFILSFHYFSKSGYLTALLKCVRIATVKKNLLTGV